jgi:tetratricopeptide (TPR) repeat protein
VHWARDDVAAALADFDKAVACQPDDALALLGRGRARLARRDAAGLADLDAALRRAPTLAEAWMERGKERLRREDVSGGTSDLEQALRLRPTLTAEVLGVVAQRGEALSDAARADLLGRILTAALPAVRERGALEQRLAAAKREQDASKRAQALTVLLGEMKEMLR